MAALNDLYFTFILLPLLIDFISVDTYGDGIRRVDKFAINYEPHPHQEEQHFVGCYSSMRSQFRHTIFRHDDPDVQILSARQNEALTFSRCWRFCAYRGAGPAKKLTFLGLQGNRKMCVCFDQLFKYHESMPKEVCDIGCKGTTGEVCKDTAMLVYFTCAPGYFSPPQCQHVCADVCMPIAFPNSNLEFTHLPLCHAKDGACLKRCIDSTNTKCPKLSETCKVLSGDSEMSAGSATMKMPTELRENEYKNGLDNLVILMDRSISESEHPNVLTKPYITKIIAPHSDTGVSYFMTVEQKSTITADEFYFEVSQNFMLWDLGFSKIDAWYFRSGTLNHNGEEVTASKPSTYLAIMSRNDHIFAKYSSDQTNSKFMEATPSGLFRKSDAFSATSCMDGTNCHHRLMNSDGKTRMAVNVYAEQAYECSQNCERSCSCLGRCTASRCRPGYHGVDCSTICTTGYFGEGCSYHCNDKCKDGACDSVTGACLYGCSEPGIHGVFCTELCDSGTYGENCEHQCSSSCLDSNDCSSSSGVCTGGCKVGYQGSKCDRLCDFGTYGANCTKTCGHCAYFEVCGHITGNCPDHMCSNETLLPPKCLCPEGTWGPPRCNKTCTGCETDFTCDPENGRCIRATGPLLKLAGEIQAQTSPGGVNPTTYEERFGRKKREAHREDRTGLTDFKINNRSQSLFSNEADVFYDVEHDVEKKQAGLSKPNLHDVDKRDTSDEFTDGGLSTSADPQTIKDDLRTVQELTLAPNWTVGEFDFPEDPDISNCASADKQSPQCLCSIGYFGEDCSLRCGRCGGVHCGLPNGHCITGCEVGYKMPVCHDKCDPGTYGPDCALSCGSCLNDMACDSATGHCPSGCSEGFREPFCQVCMDKLWGPACEFTCGKCAGDITCNSTTGACDDGCVAGFEAPFCKCSLHRFGPDCEKQCGNCKDSRGCEPNGGHCINGCSAGYMGDHCLYTCPPGRFGEDCRYGCGNCKGGTCNSQTGNCGECLTGYRPPTCHCSLFEYGPYCEECGSCKNGQSCDAVTGNCTNGCAQGFIPPLCKCQARQWGPECTDCGKCEGGECDINTGECITGKCQPGYTIESNCREYCPWGFWGKNCTYKCGACALCKRCDPISGACLYGCVPGYRTWFGHGDCLEECPDGTYGVNCVELCGHCEGGDYKCRKSDGHCVDECSSAFMPPFCKDTCPAGYWGTSCRSVCGHCKNGEACILIDGSCPTGCEKGYSLQSNCVFEDLSKPASGSGSSGDGGQGTTYEGQGTTDEGQETADGDETTEYYYNYDYDYMKMCPHNMWGEQCEKTCGYCLHGQPCHPLTGLCNPGCVPGYRPQYCKAKCAPKYFGLNCKQKCGHCYDPNEICRHTDGLCVSGCQKGWYAKNCTLKMDMFYGDKAFRAMSTSLIPSPAWLVFLLFAVLLHHVRILKN